MTRPASCPLPWCEALDTPYWQVNFALCGFRPGWREWQAKMSMAEIIPHIDALISQSGDPA